jgi:predicted MPP superfamily phosphohydrolase
MTRLAWATDIHLNFLDDAAILHFCHTISAEKPDALVITGDISEAPHIERHLAMMATALERPVFFVLGNHDYYRSSIAHVRQRVRELCERTRHLVWMNAVSLVPLSARTALVGHDGWADGRCGDWSGSRIVLNDYLHIDELAHLKKSVRLARLQGLAEEAAGHLARAAAEALQSYGRVVVATHVPPFEGACWHEGRISDPDWLPHFSSRIIGEALAEVMRSRPDKEMLVLCGHSHGEGSFDALPNLKVLTGGAEYGAPKVQRVLELD